MRITNRFLRLAGAVSGLVGLGPMLGCIGDSDSTNAGGAGGAGANGGAAGGGAGGSSTTVSNAVCAKPKAVDHSKPAIADFDSYDGSPLSSWKFALGGDSSTSILAGTFGYGDRPDGTAETFDMVTGHTSTYALEIADTNSQKYGGGMGLWISECLDATKFVGISFWVKGNAPTGQAKFSVNMRETQPITPSKAEYKTGTCTGTDTGDKPTCVHPYFTFTVTDTWQQVQAPWGDFTPGNADGTEVPVDGHNIWQLQFDVGLNWVQDADSVFVPVPAPYDLIVDTMTFL